MPTPTTIETDLREVLAEMNKKLDTMSADTNRRLDAISADMNRKLETISSDVNQVQVRLATVETKVDNIEKRLDSMDKRFDKMELQIEKVENNQGKQVWALIISRVNSPPLGAHEKSKKELQYPAACCGVVYLGFCLRLSWQRLFVLF
jgi:predicted nuclease with TOPRIM domain